MKVKLLSLLFLLSLFTVPACAQIQNIYDNDPAQKIPLGMERVKHRFIPATGGKVDKVRIEPPFWWTGMVHPELEVLIYDQNIGDFEVSLSAANGISINKVHRVQNPNYLFVELEIGPGARPGKFDIVLTKAKERKTYPYELKEKGDGANYQEKRLTPGDFIYLIMPDRFANGDYSNDSFKDMNQAGINRDKMYFRHGGDIQGVINNLDYIEELGVTAIWLNPVQENNQHYESYHGYAVTDFYNVDKRLGTNELYKKFVDECHARGLKVVMDIIFNHCGSEHWFIKDMPSEDWIHQWPEFTRPVYRGSIVPDPYASKSDRERLLNGWFDNHMPDLNQNNPRLANYLIQNIIWWTMYTGQDAYRIDTYFYPDPDFMARWAKRMQEEFPGIGMFAEAWEQTVPTQAYFSENNNLVEGFNAHMPSVKDFQLYFAILDALNQPNGWTQGVVRLYYILSQDFLYEDPLRNVLFLDNHDLGRFYSMVGEDQDKLKAGLAFMMTTRGIPSMYYGTEILLKGFTDPDGKVRQDFPGGWKEDKVNKFVAEGRTKEENEIFEYVRALAHYRMANPVLQLGKLTHFVPDDGIYVYFRHNGEKTVMCILNANNSQKALKTERFAERMKGYQKGLNIATGEMINDLSSITVDRYSNLVLELR